MLIIILKILQQYFIRLSRVCSSFFSCNRNLHFISGFEILHQCVIAIGIVKASAVLFYVRKVKSITRDRAAVSAVIMN